MNLKKAILMSSIALGSFGAVQKVSAQGGIGSGSPASPPPTEEKKDVIHYSGDDYFSMEDFTGDPDDNDGWGTIWQNNVVKTGDIANHPYYNRHVTNNLRVVDKKIWNIGSDYTLDLYEYRQSDRHMRLHYSSIHATSYQEEKRDPQMLRNFYQYPNYWARGQRDVRYVVTYEDTDYDGILTTKDRLVSQTLIINVPDGINGKTYHKQAIIHRDLERPNDLGKAVLYYGVNGEMVYPEGRPAANTSAVITSYESEKSVNRKWNNTVDFVGNLKFDDAKKTANHIEKLLETVPEAPGTSKPKPSGP